jgi:cation:H+ antiporter
MIAVAVACLPMFFTGRRIDRWEGVVFLGYYVAYTIYLVLASQRHDSLEAFSNAMIWFVIPLTVLTLGVVTVREARKKS